MDLNTQTQIGDFVGFYFVFFLIAAVFVWLLCAVVAAFVGPDDRFWAFFWCTFLLFGPLGIALALVAPARPVWNKLLEAHTLQ